MLPLNLLTVFSIWHLNYLPPTLPVAHLYCSAVWDFIFPFAEITLNILWNRPFLARKGTKRHEIRNLCSLIELLTVSPQDMKKLTLNLETGHHIKHPGLLGEKHRHRHKRVDVSAWDLQQLLKPVELNQLTLRTAVNTVTHQTLTLTWT